MIQNFKNTYYRSDKPDKPLINRKNQNLSHLFQRFRFCLYIFLKPRPIMVYNGSLIKRRQTKPKAFQTARSQIKHFIFNFFFL